MPVAPGTSTVTTLARLAGGLVVVTFGLLVVGASVRVHGAGLACPDWPLCFGEVVPTLDVGVAFEFGHRVLAGGVSLGFLGLLGGIYRVRALLPAWLLGAAGLALGTLGLQVLLGGLTVLELLAEWTVTSHLLAGNLFCLLLLVVALGLREAGDPVVRSPVPRFARGAAVALAVGVLAQLVLGGLVSASHAGLVCGAMWPECTEGAWFPTFEGLIGLHLAHRLVAYGLVGLTAFVAWTVRSSPRAWAAGTRVVAAIGVQAGIGIANVLTALPVEVTLLHTAGAAAVVLATTGLHWELWRAPAESPAAVRALALGVA